MCGSTAKADKYNCCGRPKRLCPCSIERDSAIITSQQQQRNHEDLALKMKCAPRVLQRERSGPESVHCATELSLLGSQGESAKSRQLELGGWDLLCLLTSYPWVQYPM